MIIFVLYCAIKTSVFFAIGKSTTKIPELILNDLLKQILIKFILERLRIFFIYFSYFIKKITLFFFF